LPKQGASNRTALSDQHSDAERLQRRRLLKPSKPNESNVLIADRPTASQAA
jgi:hypothetical protein